MGHAQMIAVSGTSAAERVDVNLEPGGEAIKGRVYDIAGKPLAGVRVATQTRIPRGPYVDTMETMTDANGRYRIWGGKEPEPWAQADGMARSFRRARKIRFMTVPSGQSRISAISVYFLCSKW